MKNILPSLALLFILLHSSPLFADYSDVLVVYNTNSQDSRAIATYFLSHRPGLTKMISVTMPTDESVKFEVLNKTLLQPLGTYLKSTQGENINYIVLSMDIPLWTNETEGWGSSCHQVECANSSSVDTEVMLLNGPYEKSIGQAGAVPNPYYASSQRFSRQKFGIYLVGRLDAKSSKTVKHMVDSAASFTKAERDSGLHVLATYGNIQLYQFSSANKTLSQQGIRTQYDGAETSQLPAKLDSVSYLDAFGCYNFGDCDHAATQLRNYTWKNGSLSSSRFSWSARSVQDTDIGYVYQGTKYYYNNYFVSSYLYEGATAALGYAVEPFASQVAVSQYLAENYVAGRNMGEILWSSIPTLSWAAVMFGDPKANYPTLDVETSPAYATPISSLSCAITVVDDLTDGKYDIKYEWYKNGTLQSGLSGSRAGLRADDKATSSVSSSSLSAGESWACKGMLYQQGKLLFERNVSVKIESGKSCRGFTFPGTYYLVSDVQRKAGTCINLQGNGITFDCMGHSIVGNETRRPALGYGGAGIAAFGKNITIRNCNISGFQDAIRFVEVRGATIQNSSLASSFFEGSALHAIDSAAISVSRSSLSSKAGFAIYLNHTQESVFFGNRIIGNQGVFDSGENNDYSNNLYLVGEQPAPNSTPPNNSTLPPNPLPINNTPPPAPMPSNNGSAPPSKEPAVQSTSPFPLQYILALAGLGALAAVGAYLWINRKKENH